MRSVTLKEVVEEALGLLGIPAEDASTQDWAMLVAHVNRRLRKAWESFAWPELCRQEERYWRDAYSGAVTYVAGDEVRETVNGEIEYFRRMADAAPGSEPVSDTDVWEPVGADFERYVAWEQAGQTAMGEVLDVWVRNPRTLATARPVDWESSSRGIEVPPYVTAGVSVWVKYRLRPVRMTAEVYQSSVALAAGVKRYLPETGRVYETLTSVAAGEDPQSTPAKWAEVEMPYIFAHYCAVGAYRDQLKADGRQDTAAMEERDVFDLLLDEIDKIETVGRRWKVGIG
jgi:hypothetical protein